MQYRIWNIEEDYSTLVKWWKDWKFGIVPKECLPPDGIIVEIDENPICAGGLYLCNGTTFGFMEWIVVDKNANKRDTHSALKMCIDAMLNPELAEILIKLVGDVSFLTEVRDNKSN